MHDNSEAWAGESHDWFDGSDIFFRPKDKQRFQLSYEAVSHGERGLAIIGGSDGVLDHYSRMLVTQLRDLEGFQLEVFLPNDTDSLLNRFNHILAKMTMEQARKAAHPSALVHLLVVNDAKSVKQDQWNLLVRLITDFPGTNVRLILCIDKTGWPGYEKLLGLFGRQLYRWVADSPSIDEAIQLMYAAREHGYESETQVLLDQLGLGDVVKPDDDEIMPGDIDILSEDTLMQDIGGGLVFEDDPFNFEADNPDRNTIADERGSGAGSKFRDYGMGATIIVLSLAVSLFVVYRFYPDESVYYRDLIAESLQGWGATVMSAVGAGSDGLGQSDTEEAPGMTDPKVSKSAVTPPAGENVGTALFGAPSSLPTEQKSTALARSEPESREPMITEITDAKRLEQIAAQFAAVRDRESLDTDNSQNMSGAPVSPASEPEDQDADAQLAQIEALLSALARERGMASTAGLTQDPLAEEAVALNAERLMLSEPNSEPLMEPTEPLQRTASVVDLDPLRSVEEEIVTVITAPSPARIPEAIVAVESSRSSDFFVQYIVFTSESQASNFIDTYEGLAEALVAPIALRGRPAYAVVMGPFASLGDARISANGNQMPADYWFRSAVQLKGALRTGD